MSEPGYKISPFGPWRILDKILMLSFISAVLCDGPGSTYIELTPNEKEGFY